MVNETLPGVLPTARLELEVLLGPDAEIVNITVKVEDPAGRLLALRTFPEGVKRSSVAHLDLAWRALLAALPLETLRPRKEQQAPATSRKFPGPPEPA